MKTIAKILNYSYMGLLCLLGMVFVAPCGLMFSQGNNGEITWLNFAGIVWCWVVYRVVKFLGRSHD